MNQSQTTNHKLPLIVIIGETASGKSKIALDIAKKFDGEIIGADSWTVYREFDIGTAKPIQSELAEIPHHLFSIVDPLDGFNAALFKKLANETIDAVHSRGKLPILVGGTGLYIDSVIFDYGFMTPGNPAERDRLSALDIEDVLAEAQAEGVDLSGVDVRNKRRIIRAIETGGLQPVKRDVRDNTYVIGLQVDRETLRERIEQRVDYMMSQGLEKEVSDLKDLYGWDVEPMKGIGYREWHDYFLSTQSLEQTRDRIISSTMKLAKRQRTWFKRNNSIQWIFNSDEAVELLTTLLNKSD